MSGSIVSIDPEQVNSFVRSASTQFSAAVEALNAINQTSNSANFTGRNAALFKTEVQTQLKTFVTNTKVALAEITVASNNACKAISRSLGEEISTIDFNPEEMTELSTESGTPNALTLDYTSMQAVSTSLQTNIATVQTTLRNHKNNFASIPWTGRAKEQAATRVAEVCRQGLRECSAATDLINQKIVAQVEATDQADHTVG